MGAKGTCEDCSSPIERFEFEYDAIWSGFGMKFIPSSDTVFSPGICGMSKIEKKRVLNYC